MKQAGCFLSKLMVSGIAVVAAAGFFFFCQSADSGKKSSAAATPAPAQQATAPLAASAGKPANGHDTAASPSRQDGRKLIVYYFHTTMRCPTCHKLETLAKSEVEAYFADAIKSGTLEWKTINVEEPGNEHFGDDYKLYTKSVIVSTVKDGKELSWKNLDKIWQLVYDEGRYRQYIRDEVKACLEGKCL
jgi:hypothetical protein